MVNINRNATRNDIERLHNDLFSSYNNAIRPFQRGVWTTDIYFEYVVENINEMDEIGETMTTAGKLQIVWNDTALSWDASNYSDVSLIYISQNSVWKPDLILGNGNSKVTEFGGSFYFIKLSDKGELRWSPYEVFTTLCSIETTYFPFDKQECSISFSIWNHFSSEVTINRDSKIIMKATGNGVWEVEGVSSEVNVIQKQSTANFKIKLRRKPYFFIFNIAFPIIFLGLVSTFVFLIPAVSGEKTGFSITIFLSFAVFLSILSAEMPKNSVNRSYISMYVMCEVILSVIILFITNIQIRLHHRTSNQVGVFYKAIIRFYRKCCKSCITPNKTGTTDDTTITDISRSNSFKMDNKSDQFSFRTERHENDYMFNQVSWIDVSNAIDGILFPFLTSLNIAFTTSVFALLSLN